MPVPPEPRVVVIGGGFAGLAAADRLTAAGAGPAGAAAPRVVLLDPAPALGGVVQTVRRDGWLVERAADNVLASRPEAIALFERLGLAAEIVPVRPEARRALVFHGGRPLPVPTGFRLLAPGDAAGIRATALLSDAGKARLLAERDVPARRDTDDESLESFAVRRLGREAFDRLVQPLVAGIWTADPSRLSMDAACPEFVAMEREHGSLSVAEERRLAGLSADHRGTGARYGQFVTLGGGLGSVVDRAVGRLAAAGVTLVPERAGSVTPRPEGGYRVALVGPAGGCIDADGVVVALPSPAAASVLGSVDAALATDLAAIEHADSVVVALGYRRDRVAHPLDAAGMVVPRVEGRAALAVSFASSKFAGRAPEGHVLLRVFFGGALDPERARLDDAEIVHLARRELALLLGAEGAPALVEVARWPGAMPQYHLGHRDRVARIGRRIAAWRGLALAGAAYDGVGIPQVIGSGLKAAEEVLTALVRHAADAGGASPRG
ncbi:MAG: protoporphyrinogen oxidase [Planctomycetaceae bacterium]